MTVSPASPIASQRLSKDIAGFKNLTEVQLVEFCERQRKILNNTNLLSKLKDKGEKVKTRLEAAENELREMREHQDDAIQAFGRLSILNKESEEVSLSKNRGGDEVERVTVRSELMPKFAKRLCDFQDQKPPEEKFKPFKTLKHTNEVKPEHSVKWESFPDLAVQSVRSPMKTLSLRESVSIAADKQKILKDLHILDAATYLDQGAGPLPSLPEDHVLSSGLPERLMDFRTTKELDSDDESITENLDWEAVD